MDETLTKSLKPWVIPAAVGIVSFLGGAGAGYLIQNRRYAARFARLEAMVLELANNEQVDVTNFTMIKYEKPEVVYPEEEPKRERRVISSRDPRQVLDEALLAPPRPDPTDDDVPHQPHRTQTHPMERLEMERDWNWEAELSTRTPDAPYILQREEFFNNEMGFDQDTWTYYKGDDILVDETDTPVYNYHENTGPLTFGHGSGDPSVVYIRNEDLKAEYEVVLNEGHYSVEVLGLELEEKLASEDLRHSTPRKFRDTD